MADNRFSCGPTNKGTVCIETNRILDSCRDRDCYENVRVLLTDFGRDIIEHTSTIRVKDASIALANITLDPVQFNRGFFTVNIRFYIHLIFEGCTCGCRAQEFEGVAVIEKKVVLFGGESNVSIFKSGPDSGDFCVNREPVNGTRNYPSAIVEVVDPIVLGTKVLEHKDACKCCCCCSASEVPESVTYNFDGPISDCDNGNERYLVVSIGIFSVVRIVRNGQFLVNATEYSVPDKECVVSRENDPCGIFRSMAFPVGEFSPSTVVTGCTEIEKRCGC